ncbi:hypothetical protein QBC40DRAFT_320089 [Triangularia verruculosa]|uniref:Uncharacterized protein n=1 Tax=Triangularia verruculosa TaxID=2587418 RepID=A0AAN7AZJ1_9PEZI|nr:hypothetical protein QBC40DRAFT_320089 [Triangularia verruculosa]
MLAEIFESTMCGPLLYTGVSVSMILNRMLRGGNLDVLYRATSQHFGVAERYGDPPVSIQEPIMSSWKTVVNLKASALGNDRTWKKVPSTLQQTGHRLNRLIPPHIFTPCHCRLDAIVLGDSKAAAKFSGGTRHTGKMGGVAIPSTALNRGPLLPGSAKKCGSARIGERLRTTQGNHAPHLSPLLELPRGVRVLYCVSRSSFFIQLDNILITYVEDSRGFFRTLPVLLLKYTVVILSSHISITFSIHLIVFDPDRYSKPTMPYLQPDNNFQAITGQISAIAHVILQVATHGPNQKTRTRIYLQKANEAIRNFDASFAAGN